MSLKSILYSTAAILTFATFSAEGVSPQNLGIININDQHAARDQALYQVHDAVGKDAIKQFMDSQVFSGFNGEGFQELQGEVSNIIKNFTLADYEETGIFQKVAGFTDQDLLDYWKKRCLESYNKLSLRNGYDTIEVNERLKYFIKLYEWAKNYQQERSFLILSLGTAADAYPATIGSDANVANIKNNLPKSSCSDGVLERALLALKHPQLQTLFDLLNENQQNILNAIVAKSQFNTVGWGRYIRDAEHTAGYVLNFSNVLSARSVNAQKTAYKNELLNGIVQYFLPQEATDSLKQAMYFVLSGRSFENFLRGVHFERDFEKFLGVLSDQKAQSFTTGLHFRNVPKITFGMLKDGQIPEKFVVCRTSQEAIDQIKEQFGYLGVQDETALEYKGQERNILKFYYNCEELGIDYTIYIQDRDCRIQHPHFELFNKNEPIAETVWRKPDPSKDPHPMKVRYDDLLMQLDAHQGGASIPLMLAIGDHEEAEFLCDLNSLGTFEAIAGDSFNSNLTYAKSEEVDGVIWHSYKHNRIAQGQLPVYVHITNVASFVAGRNVVQQHMGQQKLLLKHYMDKYFLTVGKFQEMLIFFVNFDFLKSDNAVRGFYGDFSSRMEERQKDFNRFFNMLDACKLEDGLSNEHKDELIRFYESIDKAYDMFSERVKPIKDRLKKYFRSSIIAEVKDQIEKPLLQEIERNKQQMVDLKRERDDARRELAACPTQQELDRARAEVPQSAQNQINTLTREREAARRGCDVMQRQRDERPTQLELDRARDEVPQSAQNQINTLTRELEVARRELAARPTHEQILNVSTEREHAQERNIILSRMILQAGLNMGTPGLLESIATLHGFSDGERTHRWTDTPKPLVGRFSRGYDANWDRASIIFQPNILEANKTVEITYGTYGDQGNGIHVYVDGVSIGFQNAINIGEQKKISFLLQRSVTQLAFKVLNPTKPDNGDTRTIGLSFYTIKVS